MEVKYKKPQKTTFKNSNLMLLWSGKSVSIVGDTFFDLAVMWVIYSQSHSTLQSALVGVVTQLSSIIMSPLAGTFADRWDRKTIMWCTNLLSSFVVGSVAAVFFIMGHLPLILALIAVLLLMGLSLFLSPAEASVIPDLIERDHVASAFGVLSSISSIAALIGKGIAGLTIAAVGSGWALIGDSLSFAIVTICVFMIKLPKRTYSVTTPQAKASVWSDLKSGLTYLINIPVLKALIWLAFLLNIASFMGPLIPALVQTTLKGSASAFGLIEASSIIGSLLGGFCMPFFEKRFSAGTSIGTFLLLASIATLGLAFTTQLYLAMACQVLLTFFTSLASILIMTAQLVLVTEEYRGRVTGFMQAIAMLAMPITTLIAGEIGKFINVQYLFVFGACWALGVSVFAIINPRIRKLDLTSNR